ncbi:Crp/Fnr family transcriptional regulator [Lentzea sp. NBRC 105346]|uniref:Crp/Fnr family transcriptional regulator n=1 Tax=Lentzea sp. NBRC 105346 TaxID=3032205 RepID=UPI0025529D10|nr:Crp/Fnr family transcriptional regulator [Lentzea sp. NBRC 105346]
MLNLGTSRTRLQGENLLRQGEEGDDVLLLLTGYVKIEVDLPEGGQVLLAIRTGGDLVGEMGPLEHKPRSATVRASTTVTYKSIAWPDLEKYLADHPRGSVEFSRMLSARLRWSNERRVDQAASRRAATRVVRVLYELMVAYGRRTSSGVDIDVSLTQKEIASLSGMSLSAAESELRELEKAGIIRKLYRRTVVVNEIALRKRAENPDDIPQ